MPNLKNKNFDRAFIAGSIILLIYLFYPAIEGNIQYINNLTLIQNDSIIYVPPFYKYLPDSVPSTYEDEYILNALLPVGYKLIYIFAAKFYDPVILSKYLGYYLLIFTIIATAYASYKLSGIFGSICTLLITLGFSADIMLWAGFYGGTPRSFAYPITALIAIGLIQCRPYFLATLTIFSTLFYPLVGIISGCSIALMMLLPPQYRKTTSDWSFKKRISFILAITFFSALLLAPQFFASLEYGPRVTPSTVENFPEAGHDGKYQAGDTIPQGYNFTWAMQYFKYSFVPNGVPFSDLHKNKELYSKVIILLWGFIFFSIAMGLQQIVKPENSSVVRLLLLFAAGLVLFILSATLQPYLYFPKRYFMFTIPIFAIIIYPYSLIKLLNKVPFILNNNLSGKITIIISLILVLIYGGRGYRDDAASFKLEEKAFLEEIARMDNNVLIAGIPYDETMAQISFYSRKNTFINQWEYHVLHEDNILNMRKKIHSIIKAYYASDIEALKHLRDEYNVTHILINQNYYAEPPQGFAAPFTTFVYNIFYDQKNMALFNNNILLQSSIVLQYDKYALYDIKKVIQYYENRLTYNSNDKSNTNKF